MTKDGKQLLGEAKFYVRAGANKRDIQRLTSVYSSEDIASEQFVHKLLEPKFNEALELVAMNRFAEEALQNFESFQEEVISCVGRDLNGLVLDDVFVNFNLSKSRMS